MTAATAHDTAKRHSAFRSGVHVVPVRGLMDLDHSAELSTTLLAEVETARVNALTDLVVDLTHSSFCDSSGLNALLQARSAAARHGITVRLAAPSHQMLRLLDLVGAENFFPLLESPPVDASAEEDGAARAAGAGTGA